MSEAFLPVGSPIDLTNCEREPIHIPGTIQPHGVLLAAVGPEAGITTVRSMPESDSSAKLDDR